MSYIEPIVKWSVDIVNFSRQWLQYVDEVGKMVRY